MQERLEQPEERGESGEREYVLRFKVPKLQLPSMFPEKSRKHIRAARKEMLLAVRGLVDAAIERMESEPKNEAKGPSKIEVE